MQDANSESLWSNRPICLLAMLAVAGFIIYGSLMPFDLTKPDTIHPAAWLEQIEFTTWSRAPHPDRFVVDVLVNVAVGVPLGFALMGALLSGRHRSKLATAGAVVLVGGMSAALATAVELLQVLSQVRQSSWNDVLAQGLGASMGAVIWPLAGPGLLLWLRRFAAERESTRFAARLLQLYLPIYLLVQLSPVDVAIGEAELAARSLEIQIPLVPFAYHLDSTFLDLRIFVGSALFTVPIGMLAVLGWVKSGTPRRLGRSVPIGVSVVLAIELAQGFFWSSHSRLSDLLAGILGVTIGVAAATWWARPRVRDAGGQSFAIAPWPLVLAAAWVLVLMGQHWYPFDFRLTPDFAKERLIQVPWIPFTAYHSYSADPLQGLLEVLRGFLLGVPLGLLPCMAWPVAGSRSVRLVQSVLTTGVAVLVLLGIEIGQFFVPTRFPDLSDVLIGATGAMVGGAMATALARRSTTAMASRIAHPVRPANRGSG